MKDFKGSQNREYRKGFNLKPEDQRNKKTKILMDRMIPGMSHGEIVAEWLGAYRSGSWMRRYNYLW